MKLRLAILIPFLLTACGGEAPQESTASVAASQSTAGDPGRGKQIIEQYACLACHQIPGFEEPHGMMGPSLAGMASRDTISGRVPNTPQSMAAYLQNPPAVDPPTRMPPLGISEEEARHITAYLFTLK